MSISLYPEASTGNGIIQNGGVNAIVINSSQNVSIPQNLAVTGTLQVGGVTTNLYPLVSGTVVPYTSATNSGTTIDFTGIPAWVKRITVMFNGVSLSSTGLVTVQLGTASGIENTGYSGAMLNAGGSNVSTGSNMSSGFSLLQTGGNTVVINGHITICNMTGNIWTESGVVGRSDNTFVGISGGIKTLSATLTFIRITSTGSDAFDAGSINILYD